MGIFQRLGKSTDAFFSYARDDDKTYSGYIQNFHEDLQKVFAGMAGQREDQLREYVVCDAEPSFFIDRQGLPLNGEFGKELRAAFEAALNTINVGKFNLGFCSIGMSEHCFYETVTQAENRVLFGKRVTEFGQVRRILTEAYGRFFRGMLARGVYPPPSQFEAWFLSAAHDDAALARVVEALPAAAAAAAAGAEAGAEVEQ